MSNFENAFYFDGMMMQSSRAIDLWDKILKITHFKRIIELGTANGNFSLYLYLWCIIRDAGFYTMDINKHWDNGNGLLKNKLGLGNHFTKIDIFQNIEEISSLIKREGRTILICDNGDKIREFKTFAPILKKGDLISVHDWDSEISEEDTRGICELKNLSPIFLEESKEERWTRIFQKMA